MSPKSSAAAQTPCGFQGVGGALHAHMHLQRGGGRRGDAGELAPVGGSACSPVTAELSHFSPNLCQPGCPLQPSTASPSTTPASGGAFSAPGGEGPASTMTTMPCGTGETPASQPACGGGQALAGAESEPLGACGQGTGQARVPLGWRLLYCHCGEVGVERGGFEGKAQQHIPTKAGGAGGKGGEALAMQPPGGGAVDTEDDWARSPRPCSPLLCA